MWFAIILSILFAYAIWHAMEGINQTARLSKYLGDRFKGGKIHILKGNFDYSYAVVDHDESCVVIGSWAGANEYVEEKYEASEIISANVRRDGQIGEAAALQAGGVREICIFMKVRDKDNPVQYIPFLKSEKEVDPCQPEVLNALKRAEEFTACIEMMYDGSKASV